MNVELLGLRLLSLGFKYWFLYMFKAIEGRPFIQEPIHEDLFKYFEAIYQGGKTRVCINIPPRAGKTVMAKYFTVYTLTQNPCANIIYTSYSQDLVNLISQEIALILQHPIYKALYSFTNTYIEEQDTKASNEFWQDFLYQQNKKEVFSSKKIVTSAGGVCIFTAIGSQILGFGAGIRNSKKFSGFIIMDDIQKSSTIRSKLMREKTLMYFEETLLSRLNAPNVPIINIQQRLHLNDLSYFLDAKYNFDMLVKPLLNEKQVCQIPSQYTNERIEELKLNNYMFASQYQQAPIALGGNIIKGEYFQYYDISKTYNYETIIIVADTALKVKEHSDYSVFIAGGLTLQGNIHILDILRGKWEAPELQNKAINIWNKFKIDPLTGRRCKGLYIEDKASGIGLIQSLKTNYGIPIMPLEPEGDKLARVENILPTLANKKVYLPCSPTYGFNPEFINECENFSRDMSHDHDDQVDALVYLVEKLLGNKGASLIDYYMKK